jgi:uncharacterized coiled-coil protein SlyX
MSTPNNATGTTYIDRAGDNYLERPKAGRLDEIRARVAAYEEALTAPTQAVWEKQMMMLQFAYSDLKYLISELDRMGGSAP